MIPKIRKARKILGETLSFRNAEIGDADFILSLRTDEVKSRYLSKTSDDVNAQKNWLKKYANSNDQAYFIIEHRGKDIGTIRIYDPIGNSFTFGSWILTNDRPKQAAVESYLMIYTYALETLGFSNARLDVRKGNERSWKFYERLGAIRTRESDIDFFYEFDNASIRLAIENLKHFLPNGIRVDLL